MKFGFIIRQKGSAADAYSFFFVLVFKMKSGWNYFQICLDYGFWEANDRVRRVYKDTSELFSTNIYEVYLFIFWLS